MSADLVHALGNDYNIEILSAAVEPHSAQELSEKLDVPIATCYRRIEELTEADLLEHHDRVLTDERRRTNVYRRNVDEVCIEFDDEDFTVNLAERTDVQNRLDDVWRTLSEGN